MDIIKEVMVEISKVANNHKDPILAMIPKTKKEAAMKGKELSEKYYSEAAHNMRQRGIMVPETFDLEAIQRM